MSRLEKWLHNLNIWFLKKRIQNVITDIHDLPYQSPAQYEREMAVIELLEHAYDIIHESRA
jgi:hypothetical protein